MTKIKLIFKSAFRDLKDQRVRTFVGVIGVCISITLLAVVLFISDSITFTFVDYISVDAGNQDMLITVRHYNGEPQNRSNLFHYQELKEQIEVNTTAADVIEKYIPRLELNGRTNVSQLYRVPERYRQYYSQITVSGINISLENSYNFGQFIDFYTGSILTIEQLPLNHCMMYSGYYNLFRYEPGDQISVNISLRHDGKRYFKSVNFTIDYLFDFNLKWPNEYESRNFIVVDLQTLYNLFGNKTFSGLCNQFILSFGDNTLYDIRDVGASKDKIKIIAADVQKEIGLNEYNIRLRKLSLVSQTNIYSMVISIVFVVVTIIGMVITGILINGILKTSVEEKIREFGINRTLGAKRTYNLYLVMIQAFLLCNFGSILGIVIAFLSCQYLLIPLLSSFLSNMLLVEIQFTYTIQSILLAYGIGVGVGLIVSLSPALKVMRLQLIESIHPYRHEDTLYSIQRKATVNYKLITVGIVLAANAGFVFFVIPRLIITLDLTLMATTLVIILLIFLIGITLAGLGLMPIIIRAVIQLFRPFSKKLHNVIKIFVFRYQRRNNSTIIIFALSFSFVIFTSTVIQTIGSQMEDQTRLQYGADLTIETYGWWWDDYNVEFDPSKVMTTDIITDLLNIEGIEKVSTVLGTLSQFGRLYNKDFRASVASYSDMSYQNIVLRNIDPPYSSTIDSSWVSFSQGNIDEVFDDLFNTEKFEAYPCIISESISNNNGIMLGDKIKIQIQRGAEIEAFPFIVIGVTSALPGFYWNFGDSLVASGNGVMISQEVYSELLDLPEPIFLDKVFIKIQAGYDVSKVQSSIQNRYKDIYEFYTVNLEQAIESEGSMFATIDILLTAVLMSTIVICIFGLLASSYSMIIERKKDIAVLRTLGLKGNQVNRLFILEALIITLSSGVVGALSGWVAGTLLATNINLFMGVPYKISFPIVNFITVFIFSTICILLGMRLLLKKVKKMDIIEIYRQTV